MVRTRESRVFGPVRLSVVKYVMWISHLRVTSYPKRWHQ